MSHVLLVSEDPTVEKQLEGSSHEPALEVQRTAWNQWDVASLATQTADVFLLDYRHPDRLPNGVTARLAAIVKQQDWHTPLMFLADFDPFLREMIQAAIGDKNVAFADPTALTGESSLREMLTQLIARHDAGKAQRLFQVRLQTRAFPHLTPEVRNPASGRLDARRISTLFAIPLKRLAEALGVEAAAMYKTPDAPSLQQALLVYERIARSLLGLVGSAEGLRVWLNTPEPDLDQAVPRDLLLSGEGEAIAELLEDMQEGQPG